MELYWNLYKKFIKRAIPVQRHITGVLENTRVFFSTPVFWCHITGVLTNTRVFSIKYQGIWQPVKYPGKWQLMTAKTTCGLFRRISGVLSFTDYSLSSSLMLDACNLYTALLELKKLRVLREWLLLKGGKPGGQTMDYTIVHGQTVSKYRCETICLKDFEVVTISNPKHNITVMFEGFWSSNKLEGGCSESLVRNIAEGYGFSLVWFQVWQFRTE